MPTEYNATVRENKFCVTTYPKRTLQGPMATLCTARFNIHKFYIPPTVGICVLRLFPCTALVDWFL